mmetsp:Transcript_29806/g.52397  ORF Transcript_29806/g.52397 Transcript_29806/m.52397 type:complete len:765 (+) Transcript_29806:86-2380(+)
MRCFVILSSLYVPLLNAGDGSHVAEECHTGDGCRPPEAGRLLAAEVAAMESGAQAIELVQINTRLTSNQEPSKTTSTLPREPKSGAEASGVTMNGEGDLEAFIAALIFNIVTIIMFFGFFIAAKKLYPMCYTYNVLTGIQTYQIPEGMLGWWRAGMGISIDQIQETVGLDQAMLIEFAQMNMKICLAFGLPMFCIMGPINCFFGGYAAGEDYLSYLSFGNVENGSSLYWIHSLCVWGVVICVQVHIYWAMERYLERRFDWLEKLPMTRATTILVENVPEAYQTDERLKDFFGKLFGATKVKQAYLAKRAPLLKYQVQRNADAVQGLAAAKFKWQQTGSDPVQRPKSFTGADLIEFYESEIKDSTEQIKVERAEAEKVLSTPGGVNGCNGFVTFSDPAVAEIASSMQYGTDSEEWVISIPPAADAVLWKDLEQNNSGRAIGMVIGYLLTAALYMLYLPLTIWITTISCKMTFPDAIQPFWEALAPTMGLLVMVSFLPTFLNLIFKFCFTMNDLAFQQYVLQNWYFIFQFVFVILVTAIGDSLFEFMKTLVMTPLEIMPMLAKTMPLATHFYMNFIALTWTSHGQNFTRIVPLSKYIFFKRVFDEERAIKMAEPEDQDYYGLGGRHARWAIMMCVGVIFGTLSPSIPLLTFVNFFLCRLVYGYLTAFAEQKKPDTGGLFFVRACRHLFVGNIFYVLLMAGVLYDRAASGGPATIAIISVFYVIWSMQRFNTEFIYQKLPFEEHIKKGTDDKHRGAGAPYVQPEWLK